MKSNGIGQRRKLCALCLLSLGVIATTAGVQTWRQPTPIEKRIQDERILRRMSEEGLSRENCYLQGRKVTGRGMHSRPTPYPEEAFPYRWDFDDGTLCGISEAGTSIGQCRVEDGTLKFSTREQPQFSYYICASMKKLAGDRINASIRGKATGLSKESFTAAYDVLTVSDTARSLNAKVKPK